jgi:hypothetical protein
LGKKKRKGNGNGALVKVDEDKLVKRPCHEKHKDEFLTHCLVRSDPPRASITTRKNP